MDTKIIVIKNEKEDEIKIREAAEIIKAGGTVVFPTETVYGLGADGLNSEAVKKIFEAKGRPQDNPLIIHVASKNVELYAKEVPESAEKLMDKFWPGPLTIILRKKDIIPNVTSANLDSIGIRMPDDLIARKLIEFSDTTIAAPSANISGRPSPTDFQRCIEDLEGKVDCIIGGEQSHIGVESTIVDCTLDPPMVLRPGGITLEMLKEVDSRIEIDKAVMQKPNKDLKPKAPGMKYRHYAPNAKVTIISGDRKKTIEKIKEMVHYNIENGKKVCILTVEENVKQYTEGISIVLGSRENLSTVARSLFEALRKCDDLGADLILAEGYEEKGVGIAIMNRLKKAAGFDVISVDN
ncbi:L-threonylcarbamoyladenylate synthase [Clostridium sp. C2-6-12]|uniref:L-threonylcarbamoyladenylate synthase n=1 Tax=Clostridium sp. C2-6-12 TaxID=2698832 RepID=UPI00136970EE|nr:L-threonylcarbamoyladenylate synthase [Clostridium sp. C2-6-12]